MTITTMAHLTPALQELVNLRLDAIDRILLNNVARSDRIGIVAEVEAQIFELLTERGTDELTRDDLLAVLTELDPPEAYLPEQSAQQAGAISGRERRAPTHARPARPTESRVGIVGGIVGMSALGMLLLMPLVYLVATGLESEELLIIGLGFTGGLMALGGLLGFALSIYAQFRSSYSVVGAISGFMALLLSFASVMFVWISL